MVFVMKSDIVEFARKYVINDNQNFSFFEVIVKTINKHW